ncbi:MAG TPA: phenylalanine--tRNA ligase subunit alpha [Candidatus Absconditabacterales bacterium]|nr:phenylalanine--tRNA ligase subunit alpha [Candidatus Absconditabacterales bacterium]HMT26682.1 phenylalanine--tRNA ligase subunit alpha [Candidatus Absconditabacterales bacterium]
MGLSKEQISAEILAATSENEVDQIQNKYLGKEGPISKEFKNLGALSPEEKKAKGQELSERKNFIEGLLTEKKNKLKAEKINELLNKEIIDSSVDGIKTPEGHYTLLNQARRKIEEIFQGMGFHIEYGHDMVSKFENFYSVNIPATHPATEMHDTFYLHQQANDGENWIMRTHTSAMQNELIKKQGVPCKFIVPGKVYRYENTDASHDTVFWQVEGVVIDRDISIAHFKDLMPKVLSAIFQADITIRMRPAFFPFVEPGFEIDASCPICQQKGCPLCKQTGRIEILGAGMIHPNVLEQAGVDSSIYSGYAFGIGLNRLVAITYGIKDIRLFTNGDLRFIKSF